MNHEKIKNHKWLRLDRIKGDSFCGECDSESPSSRAYGGQVLAQALVGAYSTAPKGFALNSLHCYFIRGAEEKKPIIYNVKTIRNGQNFAMRSVEALQFGKVILSAEFLFQKYSEHLKSQWAPKFPTGLPEPEILKNATEARLDTLESGVQSQFARGQRSDRFAPDAEIRPCDPQLFTTGVPSFFPLADKTESNVRKQYVWIRYKRPINAKNKKFIHCTLAYLSDLSLLNTALLADQPPTVTKMATSMDHSLWLHSFNFNVNEWLLYEQEVVARAHNRSVVHARIWSKEGQLIATTAQEVLSYVETKDEQSVSAVETFYSALKYPPPTAFRAKI